VRPIPVGDADRLGWWLVDPATGATRDQMDDGRGLTAEEGLLVGAIAMAGAILGLSEIHRCIVGGVTAVRNALTVGSSVLDIPVKSFFCGV
jgi:hypothetical protein